METETLMTGQKLHTCSAYLTFVALDEKGKATAIPPVIPETEEEQRRYRQAGERREYRLAMRHRLKVCTAYASLYMYLMAGLYSRIFGSPVRFTFRQHLSYHSMTPWSVSPSRSTNTIGVFACICFT